MTPSAASLSAHVRRQSAAVVPQLSQWLRLEAIWEPGSQIMPGRVTRWAARGWLCRVYLCISLGVLQPLFLLTVLLLCRQSMR